MAIDSAPHESHERMVREEWEDVVLNLESPRQGGLHLSRHSHWHHLLPANYLVSPWNPKPNSQKNGMLNEVKQNFNNIYIYIKTRGKENLGWKLTLGGRPSVADEDIPPCETEAETRPCPGAETIPCHVLGNEADLEPNGSWFAGWVEPCLGRDTGPVAGGGGAESQAPSPGSWSRRPQETSHPPARFPAPSGVVYP